ncbi:hypothetical protein [Streptomyces cupreus]|uniref:Integral membrane protein n=1 Tax=Streptomyces cupreus TaxID=2759956 RepID=A0A7X1J5T6_9ACTN|nr:hypothetical protein [Streptomyces cupreus]
MRTRVPGWRRRHNPLRRRSDVVEAWTVLVVAVLLCLAAPSAGVAAGWWAHDDARATATAQRADRHRIRAEVTGWAPDSLPTVQGAERNQRVTVRWTDPDGVSRTGTAVVPADTHRGKRVDMWLDSAGRSVPPPPSEATIWQHTVAIGACATAGAAGLVLLGHALVRHVATRHRLAEWEREWARTEPRWSRRQA